MVVTRYLACITKYEGPELDLLDLKIAMEGIVRHFSKPYKSKENVFHFQDCEDSVIAAICDFELIYKNLKFNENDILRGLDWLYEHGFTEVHDSLYEAKSVEYFIHKGKYIRLYIEK